LWILGKVSSLQQPLGIWDLTDIIFIALVNLPKSKVRSIGVSNFAPEHLQAIIDSTGVVPAVNQVERHPLLPQDPLVKYAKGKNIHLTAYSVGRSPSYY